MVLDRHNDGTAGANLGFGGEGEEDASAEGDNGGDGRLGWRFVFMVAEGAVVKDAICALVILDGGVAEVDCGFGSSGGEFSGVFVEVFEVVLNVVSLVASTEKQICKLTSNLVSFAIFSARRSPSPPA